MTKQITDKELENIDGGMDDIGELEQRPEGDVTNPKGGGDPPPDGASGGGGTSGDLQQNPGQDP